ncbi:hypothetical protein SELMODRAFT_87265 [Selaginella moellendorffii]|uniref:AP-3 complex subunit delta n=1 Tax=Selaginella moellendorffii TaxID=88036 RepID=D8R7P0_SELML|nr:AP-3 complex subunit delta [Selaginella moellendorffii]EFJ31913.1 hypothetical protein SELMODRAFT_87265 [Selaginella moellendorffii]|eukprot:XP_002967314.1 AP-3 complex subunit delta [Selaginella moellendorffii]
MAAVMDYLFQRSLDDLVKGLRSQAAASGESRYVAKALEEIRKEIKATDPHIKAAAVHKLAYLNALHGVDMAWAAFQVVEVMSMPKFSHKKIGYLAASQSFTDSTDVLLLITNLLKKDLSSKNEFEAGMALECLSRIATPDLVRDLTQDVLTMLGSSKLYIRKKATLVLFKVFSKHPESIRVAFKRLVEKLDDRDSQVVAACVSVLHELARQDPQPYLLLAPELYRLLVESTNNWLLIKLVKLFALLMPLEPRLAKKIAEPLCEQMRRTSAKSLVLECIRTITVGLLDNTEVVELAAGKLQEILAASHGGEGEDDDPNLKYLGLQAVLDLLPVYPQLVTQSKSVIISCLNDVDPSVQMASLRLIVSMVSDSNLADTVQILMRYALSAEKIFCNELLSSILSTCSRSFYELVTDFSWYVGVLGELVRVPNFEQGKEVERQLVDIGLRVESVRKDLSRLARDFLIDSSTWENSHIHRVLAAAAWIAGEYVELADDLFEIVEALLQPRMKKLPPSVQAVFLQAVLKILVHFASAADTAIDAEVVDKFEYEEIKSNGNVADEEQAQEPLGRMLTLIRENAGSLQSHVDTEVQERASNLFGLISFIEDEAGSGGVLAGIREAFAKDLGPVSQFSQQRVVVPDGLELLDDLSELKNVLGDDQLQDTELLPESSSLFTHKKEEDTAFVDESAGLLEQHRKKNEKYYLPKETRQEEGLLGAEAPQAQPAAADDNYKLAEELLVWNKPKRPKARSVVVKVTDEENDFGSVPMTSKGALKNSVLSSAIRDVLLNNKSGSHRDGSLPESSNAAQKHHHHHRRRHRREKHPAEGGDLTAVPQEGLDSEKQQDQGEQQQQDQEKQRSKRQHHRKRAKSPLKFAPRAAVVPDFLL